MRAIVLKFNVGGSYASYSYVDRPDLTYVVLAAPKTELRPYTWWFLIVGSVPYKGYFSKADAEAEIERLKADGYDTNLRTSAAFSTLGWFDDPLLSHLLKYDKVVLDRDRFSRAVSQHALPQRRRRIQRKLGQLHRPSRRHRFFSRQVRRRQR